MNFLKVIASLGIAVILATFASNLMSVLFPSSASSSPYGNYESYTKDCEKLKPDYTQENFDYNSDSYQKYQDCLDQSRTKSNDQQATESQYIWLRTVVLMLIVLAASVFIFRKYPYYAAALILGGVIFSLSYPLMARYGGFGLYGLTEMSDTIKTQVNLMKMITSLIAFAGLTVADLLFFEKRTSASENSSISSPEA